MVLSLISEVSLNTDEHYSKMEIRKKGFEYSRLVLHTFYFIQRVLKKLVNPDYSSTLFTLHSTFNQII